jgi:hypothetical protein
MLRLCSNTLAGKRDRALLALGFAGAFRRSELVALEVAAGASVFKMMEVSRHKSVDVLRGYVRRADLFKEHAGAAFL